MAGLSLLSLACMLSYIALSSEQNGPPLFFSKDCCTVKTVGGVGYTQVGGNTDGYDCDGQCVYEEDGKPGSRTCFKSGGPTPLPAKCTESFIDSEFVSVVRNSDDITFKTKIGIFSCTVGDKTEGEPIDCSKKVDEEAGGSTLEDKTNSFFFSKSPDGESEWMWLQTDRERIHCEFNETLECIFSIIFNNIPEVVASNTLFVEGAQNITEAGDDLDHQIKYCQNLCNTNSTCQFWTLSFTATPTKPYDSQHVHRNHNGYSECGIRNYYPNFKLTNINKDQFTGLKNNPRNFSGSVFVWRVLPSRSMTECQQRCAEQNKNIGPGVLPCTTWTWQKKDAICVISLYKPTRRIDISMRLPKPNLVSGCIEFNEHSCPPKSH